MTGLDIVAELHAGRDENDQQPDDDTPGVCPHCYDGDHCWGCWCCPRQDPG